VTMKRKNIQRFSNKIQTIDGRVALDLCDRSEMSAIPGLHATAVTALAEHDSSVQADRLAAVF